MRFFPIRFITHASLTSLQFSSLPFSSIRLSDSSIMDPNTSLVLVVTHFCYHQDFCDELSFLETSLLGFSSCQLALLSLLLAKSLFSDLSSHWFSSQPLAMVDSPKSLASRSPTHLTTDYTINLILCLRFWLRIKIMIGELEVSSRFWFEFEYELF